MVEYIDYKYRKGLRKWFQRRPVTEIVTVESKKWFSFTEIVKQFYENRILKNKNK